MTEAFIVTGRHYSEVAIIGVYTSRELAEEAIVAYKADKSNLSFPMIAIVSKSLDAPARA